MNVKHTNVKACTKFNIRDTNRIIKSLEKDKIKTCSLKRTSKRIIHETSHSQKGGSDKNQLTKFQNTSHTQNSRFNFAESNKSVFTAELLL